jgi:hypothetical protein
MSPLQEELLHDALAERQSDAEIIGALLQGSLARGDGYPGSDLDLFFLLRAGCRRPFVAEERKGILVEYHFNDRERTIAKIQANPMLAYGFVDGRFLRDDTGELAEIAQAAQAVIAAYRTPPEVRAGNGHWLHSSRVKISAARNAGDLLKASFVTATTSWVILEGIWGVNDLPMPPSGTVLHRKKDLTRVPANWEALFNSLFQDETIERVDAALALIDWVLEQE